MEFSAAIRLKKQYLIKVFFLLFCLVCNNIYSQDKRDYQWLFGQNQATWPEFSAFKFDFNKRPFEPEIRNAGLKFDQNNVSICDKNGNLLFYSNGCAIANREHQVMMNGDSINVGEFFYDYWFGGSCGFGYPGSQDMLILQDPNFDSGYYMIHKRVDRNSEDKFRILSLSYSYVDLTLDGGLGGVTEKNVDSYC